MTVVGQLLLLLAFVSSGYAAFAAVFAWRRTHATVARTGRLAGLLAAAALSADSGLLAWALVARDFKFAYVARYTSEALPWHFALSAFWVGQAGSLLLWAWMLALLTLAYRFWPRGKVHSLREPAFGLLMAFVWFLTAVMIFAADPAEPSLCQVSEGTGLSPLLQHPAMLLHPPVVFLGYAGWAIPCALAVVALASRRLDACWIEEARPWMLLSWLVLGVGILLGAQWAYEELGWGGYWAWDPVENGSLIPWLTGTALIHAAMVWRHRGGLKKTTCGLAVATFGLCNFATFLTRSGIFSSLHAFSQSPIGWMFLLVMAALGIAGGMLTFSRRAALNRERPIESLWSREAAVVLAILALTLLAAAASVGTIFIPISLLVVGGPIVLGAEFYNGVLIPTGLILLLTIAPAPLLRWGGPPSAAGRRSLLVATGIAAIVALVTWLAGVRNPLAIAVAGLVALAVAAVLAAAVLGLQSSRRAPYGVANGTRSVPANLVSKPRNVAAAFPATAIDWAFLILAFVLSARRRQYGGFLVHMAFVCLAVGVTGSSLGTRRYDVVMAPGQVVEWAGREIRYCGIVQRDLPEVHVVEARLEVSRVGERPCLLLPAQHLHARQDQWTTEVALHSTWIEDFYVVFYYGENDGRARLTLIVNPLVSWLWASGWIAGAGALVGLLPVPRLKKLLAPAANLSSAPHLQPPHRRLASELSRGAE
jgi:cytochrome c-type biogenesis protein CcmF